MLSTVTVFVPDFVCKSCIIFKKYVFFHRIFDFENKNRDEADDSLIIISLERQTLLTFFMML